MLNNKWFELLKSEFKKEYFLNIESILNEERSLYNIYPKKEDIFRAFNLTDYDNVKCVIIGQDPYHGPMEANGLAFSVNKGIKIPPSLRNIFKELFNDLNIITPSHGDLSSWANEGVLLLNTSLSVREGLANSHQNIGWNLFTNEVINLLNKSNNPIVFILWGNHAKSKMKLLTNPKHYIINGSHPSPLSAYRGFFGGKYFSKANSFLKANSRKEISWDLDE